MVEAGVIGARINQIAQSKLPNSTQALKVGVLNEIKNAFCRDRNETVDRIVEEFELVPEEVGSQKEVE